MNHRMRQLQCSRQRTGALLGVALITTMACGVARTTWAVDDHGLPGSRRPRCAVLASGASELPALIEARLIHDQRAVWLERAETREILKEQSLQAIFSPQAVAERAAMGKLLKADLLVLLREVRQENHEAYLELIVCETRHGLRLSRHLLPASGPAETVSSRAVKAAGLAIEKSAEGVEEVWAVPPLFSDDLTDQFAPLKQAYAYVIEQVLLQEEGMLVVELAEARAVAKEIELAASGENVLRRLPVYVSGKFRHEVREGGGRVSIELQAARGSQVLQKLAATDLSAEEVTQFLRQSAAALLKAAGGREVTIGEQEPEAKQLAGRAKQFADTGQWLEALALYEASLLLNPRDVEVLQAMQIGLTRLTEASLNAWRQDRSNREWAERFFMYHDRAWQCIGAIYRWHPSSWRDSYPLFLHELSAGTGAFLRLSDYPEVSDDVRKRCNESIRLKEEVLLEVIHRVVATHPKPSENLPTLESLGGTLWGLPGREYAATLRAVKSVADLPHGQQCAVAIARRLRGLGCAYYPMHYTLPKLPGKYNAPPVPELFQFIDELKASPSLALQAVAVELSRVYEIDRITLDQRRQFEAEYARRLAEEEQDRKERLERIAKNRAGRETSKLPPSEETSPRSPVPLPDPKPITVLPLPPMPEEFRAGGVVFRPVSLYNDAAGRSISPVPRGTTGITDVFPAADGVDVVRTNFYCICLMCEKGRLEPAWQWRRNEWVTSACYDGRFIWASTSASLGANPHLVVIDPAEKQVWTFTDRDGLPFPAADSVAPGVGAAQQRNLIIAPLAPGKVCAVGTFGRSWVGVITFSSSRGIQVDVMHEAKTLPGDPLKKEFRDQWKDPQVGMKSLCILPLQRGAGLPADGPRWLLVFRHYDNWAYLPEWTTAHPLLCDLQQRSCRVVDQTLGRPLPNYFNPLLTYGQDHGMLYAVDPPGWLLRFDCPEFHRHVVTKLPIIGPMVCHDGLFHIAGDRWLTGDLSNGGTLLDTDVPWRIMGPHERPLRRPPQGADFSKTRLRINRLCWSHHYGLLALLTTDWSFDSHVFYQVILPEEILKSRMGSGDR